MAELSECDKLSYLILLQKLPACSGIPIIAVQQAPLGLAYMYALLWGHKDL